MIGEKRTLDETSSDNTNNNPEEVNKRAKKNPPHSSIEDRLNEAINKGNETLVNELTCCLDFPIRAIDISRDEKPILITLIEHGHTSAALTIIDKLGLDSDIINYAMYTAIKKGNDILINALSTHEHFDPNAIQDQRLMHNFKKPLLCELIDHRTSDIAIQIMRKKSIVLYTRRMALEEAIRRNIPCLIKGILQIFSIEKKEIYIHASALIELFEKKYISESWFNHAVLNELFYCDYNQIDYINIIKFLIKSKKTMQLNKNFLTLSGCLEQTLIFEKPFIDEERICELFAQIHLETSISEADQGCLNEILPRSYTIYLKTLFKKYLKETKIERSLPLYAKVYDAYVSDFYEKNFIFFHRHIFMEENILELREPVSDYTVKKIIYNYECFEPTKERILIHHWSKPSEQISLMGTKGNPLKTGNNIPIGYTVYLPQGEAFNSIVVTAYGGTADPLFDLYDLNSALLDKKIVQVNLILYDVLKPYVWQLEMDENLHAVIHESINHFFNVIKNDPESLDPSLSILKEKKIFLYGHSFGGRTAIKHAQIYPNTFDGYISSAGLLDCIKHAQHSSLSIDKTKQYPWLDPVLTIPSLSSPVLLIQNLDDSVVRSNCLFSFIKKAIEAKKAHLISLHVTKESGFFKPEQLWYKFMQHSRKGHCDPLIKTHFQDQVDAIYSFVTKDKQYENPHLIAYKNYHYKKLAHKYPEQIATLMKDVIAEGMEIFHSMSHKLNDIENLNIWESYYQPVFNAYYFACKGEEVKEQFSNLLRKHFLTEEVLNNILSEILPSLHAFLQEGHRKIIPLPEIKENGFLLDALRKTVYSLHSTLENNTEEKLKVIFLKMLIVIYRTNPSFLSLFTLKEDDFKSLKNDENEFKTLLINVISKEKQLKKKAKEEAKTLGSLPVYYEEKEKMKRNLKRNHTRGRL